MRYIKGNYSIVPNLGVLAGQEAYVQSVFLWLCKYADKDGACFPSKATLAEKAGCAVRSVDAAIEKLCQLGVLQKQKRISGGTNLSNLYHILLAVVPQEVREGGAGGAVGGGAGGAHELYPLSLTKPNELSTAQGAETVEDLEEGKRWHKRTYEDIVGYPSSKVKPLVRWFESHMQTKFPNIRAQETHVSKMFQAGYTEEQIKDKCIEMENDEFWGEKGFDLANVASNIGKKKKGITKVKSYG